MLRENQLDIGREIVKRIEEGSTPYAESVYVNDTSVYTDEARFERERPVFFGTYPLVVGASVQVPEPGDFIIEDKTDIPLLIVRGDDRQVRAFANICPHRGSQVVIEACGKGARAFSCPYHAWVFGRHGELRAIPGSAAFESLDHDAYGLIELPATERAGLVWVLPRVPVPGQKVDIAKMVDAHLGPMLAADLASYGLADYHHYDTRRLSRRLNWKLTMDTFFESYHFRSLHRNTIARIIRSDLAPIRTYGDNHLMVAVRHSADEMANQPEDDWDVIGHTALVYLLWPNTIFIMQRDHVELFKIFPGKTVADSEIEILLFTPTVPDTDKARGHWDANFDLLVETADVEDFTNGATIQRNVESGGLRHVVYGRNEPLMQSWHRSLRAAVGE